MLPILRFIAVLATLISPLLVHAGTVQLSQTGQQSCWNSTGEVITCTGTGQDGEKRIGAALPVTDPVTSRFTDNNNGTISDSLNGLIWLKDANCATISTWEDALAWVNSLASGPGPCELSDNSTAGTWRLPNVNELESLINDQQPDKSFWLGTQGFMNVQPENYWTSTTRVLSPFSAWYVNMKDGVISGGNKTAESWYVWPVRGGTP